MKEIISIITVTLTAPAAGPCTVLDLAAEVKSGTLYLSESDGTRLSELFSALKAVLPDGATIYSNGRNEAWVAHWDQEAMRKLDGAIFHIEFVQCFDYDEALGDIWVEDKTKLLGRSSKV